MFQCCSWRLCTYPRRNARVSEDSWLHTRRRCRLLTALFYLKTIKAYIEDVITVYNPSEHLSQLFVPIGYIFPRNLVRFSNQSHYTRIVLKIHFWGTVYLALHKALQDDASVTALLAVLSPSEPFHVLCIPYVLHAHVVVPLSSPLRPSKKFPFFTSEIQ